MTNVTEHVIDTPLQFLLHKMSQYQNMKTKGSGVGEYKGCLNISYSLDHCLPFSNCRLQSTIWVYIHVACISG